MSRRRHQPASPSYDELRATSDVVDRPLSIDVVAVLRAQLDDLCDIVEAAIDEEDISIIGLEVHTRTATTLEQHACRQAVGELRRLMADAASLRRRLLMSEDLIRSAERHKAGDTGARAVWADATRRFHRP